MALTAGGLELHRAAMAQDLNSLHARLQKSGPARTYLVQGEERLLVDGAVRAILDAAVDDPRDPLSVNRFDLMESGTNLASALDSCRSIGLFATRQAVVVRGADALAKRKEEGALLSAYVAAPDPSTTLILIANKIDRRLGFVGAIKKGGELLHYDPPKAYEVPEWIVSEAQRLGHTMDMHTARLVADLSGHKLGLLSLIVDQLSLYVGPRNPIRHEDAETMLAPTREHGIFELIDAIGERRLVPAILHVHAMLGHKEPALRILAMLTNHVRQLWQVKEARAKGQDVGTIQKALHLHPYVAKKLTHQSERFETVFLRRAYDRLYRTNLQLKSRGLDEGLVMERLVMDLCTG